MKSLSNFLMSSFFKQNSKLLFSNSCSNYVHEKYKSWCTEKSNSLLKYRNTNGMCMEFTNSLSNESYNMTFSIILNFLQRIRSHWNVPKATVSVLESFRNCFDGDRTGLTTPRIPHPSRRWQNSPNPLFATQILWTLKNAQSSVRNTVFEKTDIVTSLHLHPCIMEIG